MKSDNTSTLSTLLPLNASNIGNENASGRQIFTYQTADSELLLSGNISYMKTRECFVAYRYQRPNR